MSGTNFSVPSDSTYPDSTVALKYNETSIKGHLQNAATSSIQDTITLLTLKFDPHIDTRTMKFLYAGQLTVVQVVSLI